MDYEKYLELNEQEMIESLQSVLRAKSEEAPAVMTKDGEVYPFGEGVQEALVKTLELGKKMGFETLNVDNYGGHIDFTGKSGKVMAIIGHLDVVPAGDGWDFDPYGAEVKDGKIFGRGTADDKGPVISCLYAMKALKDAGYEPEHTIRIILGCDEETGWKGMDYYLERVERPDFGFTPDADFPVINGEMGIVIFDIAKKFGKSQVKGLQLRSVKGGNAPNSVAPQCRAVLNSPDAKIYASIKEKAAAYKEKTGYSIKCKGVGKSLEVTTAGVSAHGAKPHLGLNAISIMMEFLGQLNFVNEYHNEFIQFYNEYIGFNLHGEGMDIPLEDEPSGKLMFNVGMIDVNEEAGKLTINVRYPVTNTLDDVYGPMERILNKYDMGLIKGTHRKPIYRSLDNPLVKLMVDVYQKHTGDTESEAMVIGGGTYARCTDNIIAYGALFPGDPDLMHQKNECITVERFRQMTKIYAEVIYKLSQGDYNI